MSIQQGVRAAMLAEPTITNITSNVYVNRQPQGSTLPNVTIIKTDEDANNTLSGASNLRFAGFQVECRGASERSAIVLADTIIAHMEDYTGAMGSNTCLASFYEGSDDDTENLGDGSDVDLHITTINFQFQYN